MVPDQNDSKAVNLPICHTVLRIITQVLNLTYSQKREKTEETEERRKMENKSLTLKSIIKLAEKTIKTIAGHEIYSVVLNTIFKYLGQFLRNKLFFGPPISSSSSSFFFFSLISAVSFF